MRARVDDARAPSRPNPMILLYVAVAALYGARRVACAAAAAARRRARARLRRRAGRAAGARPARGRHRARRRHARGPRPVVLANALSLVAGLTVLRRVDVGPARARCRRSAPSSCRSPRCARCCRLPAAAPHRFPYAGETLGRGAHRGRARRLRAVRRRGAAGAGADGAREAAAPRHRAARRRRRRAAAHARALPVPAGGRGLRAADADARERHPVLRAALRQAASTFTHKNVFSVLGWLTFGVAAVRPLALRLARAAWRCAGSSPGPACSSSATSAASSCSRSCSGR